MKDLTKIDGMNIYYNGIPAGRTVTCYVDEIRALAPPPPLGSVELTIAGQTIRFPIAMNAGDRLLFKSMTDCRLVRASGDVETIKPEGTMPDVEPGQKPGGRFDPQLASGGISRCCGVDQGLSVAEANDSSCLVGGPRQS